MHVWVFEWWRKKKETYTKSITNPFPTSIRLSTSQYHWLTTLHVQHWLASIQTCVCDVYCFWLEVLPMSVQCHHEKYCWNTHQSTELIKNRSVCNNRKGPRKKSKQSNCSYNITKALVFAGNRVKKMVRLYVSETDCPVLRRGICHAKPTFKKQNKKTVPILN